MRKRGALIPPFKKTDKQREAIDLMNKHNHVMLFGGSRSGKTFIILRQMVLRALKKTSRHLIIRWRYNHVKQSIVHDTFPEVMRLCFPGVEYVYNAQDAFYEIPNMEGGVSTIWIAGIDSKERSEKALGTEYSTVFVNECSQVGFDALSILWTRLAETSGLSLRFYYDCNPPGQKHWAYKLFIKNEMPDGEPHTIQASSMLMNPIDNLDNLPTQYIDILKTLPKRQRQRFLEGIFLQDVEGALWTDLDIVNARKLEAASILRTVVAVDPSVSDTSGSDECGIVVCSIDENGNGVVEADYSGKMSTGDWAQAAVKAYHDYQANLIIAESNQGGDLISDSIHNVDGGAGIKVELVRASRGKQARAEPVQMLYEQGKVAHLESFPELETELVEWVPTKTTASPNRLDALVWGLTHLMLRNSHKRIHIGAPR
jgi:phage terminase large subunit-like protein